MDTSPQTTQEAFDNFNENIDELKAKLIKPFMPFINFILDRPVLYYSWYAHVIIFLLCDLYLTLTIATK